MLLGDRVYHLQYSFEDRIFHIVRDHWEDFRFQYGVVENRNIELYEWNLSERAKQTLRQKWNELYLVQETHIQNQRNLQEALEWNESLSINGPFQNTISGLGYFTNLADPNSVIPKLFRFQTHEIEIISKTLKRWEQNTSVASDGFDEVTPLPDTSSPLRLVSTIQTKTNHRIQRERKHFVRHFLQNPVQLYEQAFVKLEGDFFSLTHDEVIAWEGHLKQLVGELRICVLKNECFDWEEMSLLLRILYIQKSIQEGQILFPKKNFTGFSYFESIELPVSVLNTKQKEYEALFIEKRNEFKKEYHPISFYNWESFLSRYQSFMERKQFTEGIEFNLVGHNPYRYSVVNSLDTIHNTEINQRRKEWETYTKQIQTLYSYHLVLQNCTNELFFYLNLLFPEGKIGEETFWDPLTHRVYGLNFVPSIAAMKFSSSPYTKEYKLYPSYRNLKRKQIKDWKEIHFKERFVPTSIIYRPNPMDHSFLFFTEESIWNRPILGFANLLWGVGYIGVGIVKAPFDGGKDVSKGTDTIFYSVPELFFFNIRKGHFPLIAADEIPEEYYEKETP